MTEKRMTTEEAAEYIGVSAYLLKLARSKYKHRTPLKSPPFLKVGKAVFYFRQDLDDWLMSCRIEPKPRRQAKSEARP